MSKPPEISGNPVFKKHGSRYPWAEWFKKRSFTLKHGVDFHCLPHGMAMSARHAAKRANLSISVEIGVDMITIRVFTKDGSK